MRNPLNSILAQNIKLQDKFKSIKNFISHNSITRIELIRKEVNNFVESCEESLRIQMSSTKLLDYTVNDMLSLAQLNSKNLRHDNSNFDVKDAINELISIQ